MIDWAALERAALAVQRRAHAPYSRYLVGAALQTASGAVFAGCNVENASYGLSICAERSAIVQMVAAGERDPVAIVVVTRGPACSARRAAPAVRRSPSSRGICRSACWSTDDAAPPRTTSLEALLPDAFRDGALKG